MRNRKEVIIDGVKYDIGPISPTKSVKLMTKITKVLGPSLVKMLKDGFDPKKNLADLDIGELNLDEVFAEFFDRLDEDELQSVMTTLLSSSLHSGTEVIQGLGTITEDKFDVIFQDTGVLHMFKVVKESVGVTYSDFFAGNGGLLSKLKGAVAEKLSTK